MSEGVLTRERVEGGRGRCACIKAPLPARLLRRVQAACASYAPIVVVDEEGAPARHGLQQGVCRESEG